MNNAINPDSAILQQLDGQWQKIAAVLLLKLKGREMVNISLADLQNFMTEAEAGRAVLFTHGHIDSFDLQIIDQSKAREIAAWDKSRSGTA